METRESRPNFYKNIYDEKFRMVSMLPDGFDEKQQRQKVHYAPNTA